MTYTNTRRPSSSITMQAQLLRDLPVCYTASKPGRNSSIFALVTGSMSKGRYILTLRLRLLPTDGPRTATLEKVLFYGLNRRQLHDNIKCRALVLFWKRYRGSSNMTYGKQKLSIFLAEGSQAAPVPCSGNAIASTVEGNSPPYWLG